MRLSVAIQTHRDRAELAERLAAAVEATGFSGVELVFDPDPDNHRRSPWRCYRDALERTPAEATHRLVIQDDATVCRNFAPAALAAITARPGYVVSFYVGGAPSESARRVLDAGRRGVHWAELPDNLWVPAVALAWPVPAIAPFLRFVDLSGYPPAFRADDEIIGRGLRKLGQQALATVPSLVEHRDVVPSLVGQRARAGADRNRVAVCFIGDCDPLAGCDWTLGPGDPSAVAVSVAATARV